MLAEERRARGGTGHMHSLGVPPPKRLGHLGAADHGAQSKLVATGQKNPIHPVEDLQPLMALAVRTLCYRK
jgi:hypothetical protein